MYVFKAANNGKVQQPLNRNRCQQPSKWAIIMGDDELFWLVSNRQASRLLKQGYELAG